MLGYWRKINIDEYITNIKDYYIDCSRGSFTAINTVNTLNQEEKIYLNENLHLDQLVGAKKPFVLNKILQDTSKFNFAQHLLTSLNIDLDVNNIDESKKTTFQLLIENTASKKVFFPYGAMLALYTRGYINTQTDGYFLLDFYNTKISSQQMLELWCLSRICFKLNDVDAIGKALSKDRVIFSILSFKTGRPFVFNFPNLLGVANNALQHYREQGDLILYAMKYYKVENEIRQRDKKGTFRLREEEYQKFKPIQDTDFNETAFQLFPELRH
jgi:hypothetical protein